MVSLLKITRFLNKVLDIKNIPDYSKNGIQARNNKDILKLGSAVDASLETVKAASRKKVDLLVVHHGMYWKGKKFFKEYLDPIESMLKKNKISLYAAHIPLDHHNIYGNNIQLARLADLQGIKPFAKYNHIYVGYKGKLKKKTDILALGNELKFKLSTEMRILSFGKRKISTVGIVSGSGRSILPEVSQENLDCFVTGELDYGAFIKARDLGLNIIILGHYETETLGVQAIGKLLNSHYGLKYEFIDVPSRF